MKISVWEVGGKMILLFIIPSLFFLSSWTPTGSPAKAGKSQEDASFSREHKRGFRFESGWGGNEKSALIFGNVDFV